MNFSIVSCSVQEVLNAKLQAGELYRSRYHSLFSWAWINFSLTGSYGNRGSIVEDTYDERPLTLSCVRLY
jgi:hypothetical protein